MVISICGKGRVASAVAVLLFASLGALKAEENVVTLEAMAAEYAADQRAADAKYRDVKITTTGVVERIEKDVHTPGQFNVYLKSPVPTVRFKLLCNFTTAYSGRRDKIGYQQTDFKIDLRDNGNSVAVQRVDTTKTYYGYYYYYGRRRTIDRQSGGWVPIIAKGDTVKAAGLCRGKTIAVEFGNCEFIGLNLPFLSGAQAE